MIKLFKKENWVLEFKNEWSQLKGKYNWYSFTPIWIYFENEGYTGGVELSVMFMGLGFYLRYNYDFEGSDVGKKIEEHREEIKALN